MKVTEAHLKESWKKSLVDFVNKDFVDDLLLRYEKGTFLLRFSDGEPGKCIIYNQICL